MGWRYQFTNYLPSAKTYWIPSKKTYGYKERDESKRQTFLEKLSDIDPKMIIYADKSGMDNHDEYDCGWNERGKGFYALKSGTRKGRVNMIAAYRDGQLFDSILKTRSAANNL